MHFTLCCVGGIVAPCVGIIVLLAASPPEAVGADPLEPDALGLAVDTLFAGVGAAVATGTTAVGDDTLFDGVGAGVITGTTGTTGAEVGWPG